MHWKTLTMLWKKFFSMVLRDEPEICRILLPICSRACMIRHVKDSGRRSAHWKSRKAAVRKEEQQEELK